MGHPGLKLLKKTTEITNGAPNLNTIKEVDFKCIECNKGKIVRRASKNPIPDPPNALDVLEADTFKISPKPINNCPVGLIIVDRKSRYRWVFLIKDREGPTVFSTIKSFFKLLKNQYGRYPKKFHYDEGTEINSECEAWIKSKGTIFSTSSPYIHEQNGLVERSIRVLIDRLRTTIIASKLPLGLWCYILPSVLEMVNKTAITNREYTPFQLFFDDIEPEKTHKPDLSHYKIIGSVCEALIPHEKRVKSQKLAERTETAKLIAVLGSKIYLVYIPKRRVVLKTSFIKLLEGVFSYESAITPEGENRGKSTIEKSVEIPQPLVEFKPTQLIDPPNPEGVIKAKNPGSTFSPEDADNTPLMDENRMEVDVIHYLVDLIGLVKYNTFYANSQVPKTYKQVLKSPDKGLWLEAIFQELDQIVEKNVFKFISQNQVPKNRKLITSRWVLTKKPTKLKARLVVRGFQQVEGLDYTETFASTSNPPTWRILLALAAVQDLEIEQIDFIGAFLNGDLPEDIYIEIPEGIEAYSKANLAKLQKYGYNPFENQAIHLEKALYGLKQAPKQWQDKVKALLLKLGYKPLISDTAVYYNLKKNIFVATHIDDCLLIGPNLAEINTLKQRLNRVYAIEDLGPASLFLGVKIVRNRAKKLLWLNQSHYITEALARFNYKSLRSVSIPLQPSVVKAKIKDKEKPLNQEDFKLFQRILGTIMYLMVQTRPDICFSVQWLSRFLQEPYKIHLNASKSLLRYLSYTKDLALCYGRENYILKGFADSDFAGCILTGKSTWGYLFQVAGGPISWRAKRASYITLSTLEAEFCALTEATKEAEWLNGLFAEILASFELPIIIFGDNEGSNTTAYNSSYHNRTKHTLIRFQYVKEKVIEGLIKVVYTDTNHMPADGLTKPLSPQKQKAFLSLIGLEKL